MNAETQTPILKRRRPGRTPIVTVRMPRDLFERLHREAWEHRASLNQWCIYKLKQRVGEDHEPETAVD